MNNDNNSIEKYINFGEYFERVYRIIHDNRKDVITPKEAYSLIMIWAKKGYCSCIIELMEFPEIYGVESDNALKMIESRDTDLWETYGHSAEELRIYAGIRERSYCQAE